MTPDPAWPEHRPRATQREFGTPTRVALVDGHSYLRAGLVAVLAEFADMEVVASVASVEELDVHTGVPPDVVVAELNLPGGMSGPAAVRHLCDQGYRVLLVTAEPDPGRLLEAIRAGALGFLGKSGDGATLRAAIRAAAANERLLSARVAERMTSAAARTARLTLSPALAEVLRLVAEGLDNNEIARVRSVSVSTVKKQIREIRDVYEKGGHRVRDRADLREAGRARLVTGAYA